MELLIGYGSLRVFQVQVLNNNDVSNKTNMAIGSKFINNPSETAVSFVLKNKREEDRNRTNVQGLSHFFVFSRFLKQKDF